uniref:Uncharacterized protein n=1 Tax=Moniliophthora roreri TaxID=221103 RepID=A0A0W0FZ49_MONRR
MLAVFMNI